MVAHTHSPSLDHQNSDGSIRKRVCKACDRCRLKKSKCDGSSPCSRCKADNAICVFGERKKSHDKIYPKGYVEMLEQQQTQLVTGLQELYKRTVNGQGWMGSPLSESNHGNPLTHDILERLGALKQEGHGGSDIFEENTDIIQQRLYANGAGPMQRTDSLDGSESPRSSVFDSMSSKPLFSESFSLNTSFPPTPPDNSPFPYGIQNSPTSFKAAQFAQPTPRSAALNPAALQQQSWHLSGMMDYSDSMTFSPADFDAPLPAHALFGSQASMNTINPSCLPIGSWTEDQTFEAYINPLVT